MDSDSDLWTRTCGLVDFLPDSDLDSDSSTSSHESESKIDELMQRILLGSLTTLAFKWFVLRSQFARVLLKIDLPQTVTVVLSIDSDLVTYVWTQHFPF